MEYIVRYRFLHGKVIRYAGTFSTREKAEEVVWELFRKNKRAFIYERRVIA